METSRPTVAAFFVDLCHIRPDALPMPALALSRESGPAYGAAITPKLTC